MTTHELAKTLLLKPPQSIVFLDLETGECFTITTVLNRPTGLILTNG